MGKEALGPVKARCPTVGECEGREVEICEWRNTLIETGAGGGRRRGDRRVSGLGGCGNRERG